MSNLEYKKIRHLNRYYAVIKVDYKEHSLPVVIDWDDINVIRKLNKKWRSNQFGFISCSHTYDDETKEVFLHEIIMAMKMKNENKKRTDKPIVHIDRIGLDNRRENLMYDEVDKDQNKNIKKKKRTISLPAESGIKPSEIPTYVWYMKPNGSHGERFMVDVGDVQWKTTSSKQLSLRYKLEEAKKYLRELTKSRQDLFEDFSMNGDYTKDGNELMKSYYDIVQRAGYDNIKTEEPTKNTVDYIKPGKISRKENAILKKQDLMNTDKKRRVINKLTNESDVDPNDLPKYCYFRSEYGNRGSYFIIEGHPELDGRVWQSTSSKKVSTKDKFDQMMDYYTSL